MNRSQLPTASPGLPGSTNHRYYLLYELFHSISSSLEPEKTLNLIIDAAVHITGATNGTLVLVDWESMTLNIEVSRGFGDPRIKQLRLKVGEGVTGWVAKTGRPLLLRDVSKDDRYVQAKVDIRSELAVPLVLDEQLIGVLNVDSTRLGAFSEEDLDLLTLLSKQSAQVIKNGRLFDTVSRKVEELSTLIEINKTVASTLSLDMILSRIVERTARLMDSQLCVVALLSEDGEEFILAAQHGATEKLVGRQVFPVEEESIATVMRLRGSLQIEDLDEHEDYPFRDMLGRDELKSVLVVPLVVRERAIGVIKIYKSERHLFSDDEKRLLTTFADLAAIAIENGRIHEKMLTLEEQSRRAARLTTVGELAVGIAHEIRNPLTIVKMIFEAGDQLNERDREVISEEMNRMNEIITHLLDYTRPREPVRIKCRINRMLENTLLLASHEFRSKKITVRTELAKELPFISADPVQLQQVFLNLLLNSGEAISGSGEILVKSTYNPAVQAIEIVVADNGGGIPDHVQQNLFTPFTTTKPNGLGLGLSIVKRIIDQHGGELMIDSAAGSGTRVQVRFFMDE